MKSFSRIITFSFLLLINSFCVLAGSNHFGKDFGFMHEAMYSQNGYIILILIGFLFLFWLWMLIDCIKRDFKKDIDKAIWIFLIVFIHILGALLYNIMIKAPEKKQEKK